MEQQIDCFHWQNRSSDYLDGTLPDPMKREADDHLENCKTCNDRHKHYRLILSSIAGQSRSNLPAAIKKSPLSTALPKGQASQLLLARWEQVPWSFRTLIEGISIVLVILGGISSAPKLRALYEKNVEKSLNEFKDSASISDPIPDAVDPNIPPLQEKATAAANPNGSSSESGTPTADELAGEDDSESERPKKNDVHVGRSELWRFTLKTVSPDELRPQVVKTLTTIGISQSVPGLGGTQVPGGIEFDMVLPQTMVPEIKRALEKMAPPPLMDKPDSKVGKETFTWYRVKSKRKLPNGTSQVVIWLSQPNSF